MKRSIRDLSCLVCGKSYTRSGFICPDCYATRYGTVHARWHDEPYLIATGAEPEPPIVNASEARFELKKKRTVTT